LNAGQTPADFAPVVLGVISGPNASDDVRQQLLESMSAISVHTYRDALNCFTNPAETFDFSRLTMPVLMMTGEHDRLAPPAEIRGIANRIVDAVTVVENQFPDVQFEIIDRAGHVCNLENPQRYNHLLQQFLHRVQL
jgi:pimeloyl-ACP methyl ester carboxylesterase